MAFRFGDIAHPSGGARFGDIAYTALTPTVVISDVGTIRRGEQFTISGTFPETVTGVTINGTAQTIDSQNSESVTVTNVIGALRLNTTYTLTVTDANTDTDTAQIEILPRTGGAAVVAADVIPEFASSEAVTEGDQRYVPDTDTRGRLYEADDAFITTDAPTHTDGLAGNWWFIGFYDRIRTTPDLEDGDQIEWYSIQGTGDVTLAAPGTVTADEGVTGFSVIVHDGTSWGEAAALVVEDPSFDLDGTISAQSSATGSLDTQPALSGVSAGQSGATGSLDAQPALSGGSDAQSSASGSLSLQIGIAGQIDGESAASATLVATLGLSGSVQGHSAASGSLAVDDNELTGTLAAQSGAQGQLRLIQGLGGVFGSLSAATGRLSLVQGVAGTSAGQSGATGALSLSLGMSGTISTESAASGDLSGAQSVTGGALKAQRIEVVAALNGAPQIVVNGD